MIFGMNTNIIDMNIHAKNNAPCSQRLAIVGQTQV